MKMLVRWLRLVIFGPKTSAKVTLHFQAKTLRETSENQFKIYLSQY